MRPNNRGLWMAALSFAIGALAVFATTRVKPEWFVKAEPKPPQPELFQDFANREKDVFKRFNEQFSDDFFKRGEPFDVMKKFREEMGKDFAPTEDEFFLKDPFDRWFGKKFGGGSVNDITQREDSNFVYYDIKVDDLKSTSIETKVENGYLSINGKQQKKLARQGEEANFESSFRRTFPVPPNVDSSKMETTTEDGKIVIKFPKLKP